MADMSQEEKDRIWQEAAEECRQRCMKVNDWDPDAAEKFVRNVFEKYTPHRVNAGKFDILDGPIEAYKRRKDIKDEHGNIAPVSLHGPMYDFLWIASYFYNVRTGLEKPHPDLDFYVQGCLESGIAGGIYNTDEPYLTRPMKNVCINEAFQLHNETGPAMVSHDGFVNYSLENITIPDNIFVPTFVNKNAKPEDVLGISNAEVRTVVLKYYGMDKVLDTLGAKLIDTHSDVSSHTQKGCTHELWDFDYMETAMRCVVVEDHTTHKRTPLLVDRDETTNTAKKAIAWTWGPRFAANPDLYWNNIVDQS